MKAVRRAVTAGGGGLAILVCALATHAAAYRSFWPSDGVHGYFGWYEPLVGVLSGIAGTILLCALALGLRARRNPPSLWQRTLLAWLRPWRGSSPLVGARLAAASLGVLLVQESIERSVSLRQLAVASFPASTWLVVCVSVVVGGTALTFLARWCTQLVGIILSAPPRPAFRSAVRPARQPAPPSTRRRPNPLATGLGMRAPPVTSSI